MGKKFEVFKNKARVKAMRLLRKKYEMEIMKAIVIQPTGRIHTYEMLASHKHNGLAYQVNEVWREITPEARLTMGGMTTFFYVGDCMQPLLFTSENLKMIDKYPENIEARPTVSAKDGEPVIVEGYKGLDMTGIGYQYVTPTNFKKVLESKVLGELMQKENALLEKSKTMIVILVIIGALIYVAQNIFGIKLI